MKNERKSLHKQIEECVKKRFYFNINDRKLIPIKDFMILWNIFENKVRELETDDKFQRLLKVYRRKQNNSKSLAVPICCLFDSLDLEQLLITKTFKYIKLRYVEDGQTNWRFNDHLYKNEIGKTIVESVLLQDNTTNSEKLLVIAWVLYKYRCNLFHGGKNAESLIEQRENFKIANKVLLAAIQKMLPA